MEKEEWKLYHKSSDVCMPHLRVIYEVSDQGHIRRNGKIIELDESKRYLRFFSSHLVHRAVAELFIPNPDNKPCVDHINGDKHDNRAINLRWVTYSENLLNPITRSRRIGSSHKMPENFSEIQKIVHKGTNKGEKNPAFGRKWMSDGVNRIYPKPEEFDYYLSLGYHFGQK